MQLLGGGREAAVAGNGQEKAEIVPVQHEGPPRVYAFLLAGFDLLIRLAEGVG